MSMLYIGIALIILGVIAFSIPILRLYVFNGHLSDSEVMFWMLMGLVYIFPGSIFAVITGLIICMISFFM
jgi:hypothetical protein